MYLLNGLCFHFYIITYDTNLAFILSMLKFTGEMITTFSNRGKAKVPTQRMKAKTVVGFRLVKHSIARCANWAH